MAAGKKDHSNPRHLISHVHAADCRLRVKQINPPGVSGHAPWLIFLHEGLGCIELWKDFPETLCEAVQCPGLVYDRKGYGGATLFKGPWPFDYLITESTVYLPALLKACGVDQAVLIGHSDGGSIALISAASCGKNIRGVITEAAHIFVEDVTLDGIREAVNIYETTDLKDKLARYHGNNTETVFRRWADTWLDPGFKTWNIEAFLPQITCPVLVIQGEDDEYGTSAQINGIARQVSGPVETALIPACRHVPHLQARDAVLERMIRFISGWGKFQT
jgi:pimeloyl-ACP methyl ester carboxylesterase